MEAKDLSKHLNKNVYIDTPNRLEVLIQMTEYGNKVLSKHLSK